MCNQPDTGVGASKQQTASGVQQGRVDRGYAGNNGNDTTGDRGVSGISIGTEKWILGTIQQL